jgi:hypothetical protein
VYVPSDLPVEQAVTQTLEQIESLYVKPSEFSNVDLEDDPTPLPGLHVGRRLRLVPAAGGTSCCTGDEFGDGSDGDVSFSSPLPQDRLTLADVLSGQGILTAGFVANPIALPNYVKEALGL